MLDGSQAAAVSVLSLTIALAAPRVQDASNDHPQGNKPCAVVVDALIEQTNGLKAFVADYRFEDQDPKKCKRMHLVYQRDRGLAWTTETADSTTRVLEIDGKLSALISASDGSRKSMDIDYKNSILAPRDEIDGEFEASFPEVIRSKHRFADAEPAIAFSFMKDAEPGRQLNLGPVFDSGADLLGWLTWLKKNAPECREQGDRLIYEMDENVHLKLSRDSGFIVSLEKTVADKAVANLVLENLDLEPSIEKSAFELPTGGAGVVDMSAETMNGLVYRFMSDDRDGMCMRLAAHVQDKSIAWDDGARNKMTAVFSSMHRRFIAPLFHSWSDATRARITEFGRWLESRYASDKKEDPNWRNTLDGQVSDWVSTWKDSLEKSRDSYAERISVVSAAVAPPDLRHELEMLMADTAKQAFDTEVMKPLLESFDSRVDEVMKAAGEPPRSRK
jgi:hypothetical protein